MVDGYPDGSVADFFHNIRCAHAVAVIEAGLTSLAPSLM